VTGKKANGTEERKLTGGYEKHHNASTKYPHPNPQSFNNVTWK
jgi:hypothetical protein